MLCLFFYARSREIFGPRLHIDLAFYPGQPTSSLLTPRATPLTPLRRIAANCPLLFRRNTSTLTSESLFISCLRTRPGSHIVSHSSASVRTAWENSANGNERFGAAEKGQLWLKPLPFSLFPRFTYACILAIFPKEHQPHLSLLGILSGYLWP